MMRLGRARNLCAAWQGKVTRFSIRNADSMSQDQHFTTEHGGVWRKASRAAETVGSALTLSGYQNSPGLCKTQLVFVVKRAHASAIILSTSEASLLIAER